MHAIRQITAHDTVLRDQLKQLLRDAVEGGASVGYVLPLADDDAGQYWQGVFAQVEDGSLILLVAENADQIIGTVQLSLCSKPNGKHRAEVQKMLVHTSARRRGLGRDLMQAVEQAARASTRSLLVLDTESGSAGQHLYAAMGYLVAGEIPNFALPTIPSQSAKRLPTTYMYKLL